MSINKTMPYIDTFRTADLLFKYSIAMSYSHTSYSQTLLLIKSHKMSEMM